MLSSIGSTHTSARRVAVSTCQPRGRIVPYCSKNRRGNGNGSQDKVQAQVPHPIVPLHQSALKLDDLKRLLERTKGAIEEIVENWKGIPIEALTDEQERHGSWHIHPEHATTCCEQEVAAKLIGAQGRRLDQLHALRKELERAIKALEAGEENVFFAGQCKRCGGVIPLERLKVVPETSFCVDCA